ncbi:MAG TPA: PAS domain-containing protein, partial [Motilibacteraceae bacterium]|nr:PAS domain-containing protein [Motilibacteraceae bacterium]
RLRALLAAAPVGVAELDAEGRLVLANRTLETLADRRWYQLLGRPWTVLAHHYDRSGVEGLWASASPSRVQLRATFRVAVPGADRWVEAFVAPGPDDGWVLVLTDAGERVAASAALVDSERWLRAVLDAVPVGLAVHTLDGRAVAVNEALASTLGTTREALGGASPGDLAFTDEDGIPVPLLDRPSARAVRTGRPASAVLGTVDGAGEHRWLQVSARALPLDDETLARGVVTTAVDVTADRALAARLARSERRHQALLEAAGDLLLELDAEGRCRPVPDSSAPACTHLLGLSPEQLTGQRLQDLAHPDDAAALSALAAEPAAAPVRAGTAGRGHRLLLRLRRAPDTYGWVQVVALPEPDGGTETGSPAGWVVQLRDVDDLVGRQA